MATPPQDAGPKTQKRPGGHKATGRVEQFEVRNGEPLFYVLAPIERIRPGPGSLGVEQAIARTNEVVG